MPKEIHIALVVLVLLFVALGGLISTWSSPQAIWGKKVKDLSEDDLFYLSLRLSPSEYTHLSKVVYDVQNWAPAWGQYAHVTVREVIEKFHSNHS